MTEREHRENAQNKSKMARTASDEDTARIFEQIAIEGETYECSEVYLGFRKTAVEIKPLPVRSLPAQSPASSGLVPV